MLTPSCLIQIIPFIGTINIFKELKLWTGQCFIICHVVSCFHQYWILQCCLQCLHFAVHKNTHYNHIPYSSKCSKLKTVQLLFYSVEAKHTTVHILNSILNFLLHSIVLGKARLSFVNWFEQWPFHFPPARHIPLVPGWLWGYQRDIEAWLTSFLWSSNCLSVVLMIGWGVKWNLNIQFKTEMN